MKSLGTGADARQLLVCRNRSAPQSGHRRGGPVGTRRLGSGLCAVGARVIEAFVDKQRRLDNNLQEANVPSKVEVGAVWSDPPEQGAERSR